MIPENLNHPKLLIKRQAIIQNIINFYNNRSGRFYGWDLFKYVTASGVYGNIYMDTVLRYMRLLREKGVINYSIVGSSKDSLYEIIK